jgi:hypothetical protein
VVNIRTDIDIFMAQRRGWRIAANITKLPGLLRRGAALDRSTSTPRASSSKTR